jgi:hypothetical protein
MTTGVEAPPHRPGFAGPPLPLPGGEEPKLSETATLRVWRFLSPGQGERWHAKRDGEGVLLGEFAQVAA